jgi:hypothetical protein
VPKPPNRKNKCYGTYDGNSNPVINIILEDETEAGITSEDWYSRTSCTPSFKSDHSLKVGTAIADIIEYINNIILSGCKDNKNLVKGTLIDLHYYPDISSFGKEYNHKIGQFNDANMPTKFDKYTSTHYYAALSPYMHLKRCAGECYPQRFKEFLLKSGLFRQGNKNEFRDLRREAIDENEAGPGDMRKNNCYKWLSNY